MNYADEYLSDLLNEYKKMEMNQKNEFRRLPPGQLIVRQTNGKRNFVQLLSAKEAGGKPARRGITKNRELVQDLARKKYLRCALPLLEKNIAALEELLILRQALTLEHIQSRLPAWFRELPPETFLPELRERSQWEHEEFEQDTSRPEGKMHVTARGLKVRSKSEVIIAERLDLYEVPFRYEQVLYIENQRFSLNVKAIDAEIIARLL